MALTPVKGSRITKDPLATRKFSALSKTGRGKSSLRSIEIRHQGTTAYRAVSTHMTPGARTLGLTAVNVNELIHHIEVGFPARSLEGLAESLQVTVNTVLTLTGISPRSFARRKTRQRLSTDESERVARLARVTERAHVLMGAENGNRWLNQPWPALNHQTPLAYSRTDLGAETVIDLIGALDEGIFV